MVESKINNFLLNLKDFLNENGFFICNDKIAKILPAIVANGIDFSDVSSVILITKSFLCDNKDDSARYESLFKQFFKDYREELLRKERQIKEESARELKLRNEVENSKLKAETLKHEIEMEKYAVNNQLDSFNQNAHSNLFTKRERELLNGSRKFLIKKMSDDDTVLIPLSTNIFDELGLSGFKKEQIKQIEKNILLSAQSAVKAKDITKITQYKAILSGLKKAEKSILENSRLNSKLEEKEKILNFKYQDQCNKRAEAQEKLNRLLKDNSDHVLIKESSTNHRIEFLNNGGSVQCSGEGVLDKDFKLISKDEILDISDYLDRNLLKFKTKMSHNIQTSAHKKLDVKKTIQSACKTDGIPMVLNYVHKKPQRSKLILVLDISGSCKAASKMMLLFMHKLKEVFPGGCEAFVFVDTLYDISDILIQKNAEKAIEDVFKVVPVRGVYSNYGTPIKTLFKEYRSHFTKETFVVWIGDYRNNKNDSALYEFKNLCDKAKKTYLLNTENFDRWNKADSIIGEYQCFSDNVFQVTNTSELVSFIENI